MNPTIKENNQQNYLSNYEEIVNNQTASDFELQIENFVAQFVFPYIRGWVPKDEYDNRTPLMVALKQKIGIPDDPELEDRVGKIALNAYFDEAAKGLYVLCEVLSFEPFDAEGLPNHLMERHCGNFSVEEGEAAIVEYLEESILIDFPGFILSEDEMKEKANQSMVKCNDQRLSDYELENTRRVERDKKRQGIQKRKRAKLKELNAERKESTNRSLRLAVENREWETIEKLFYNKLITYDTYCWAIDELGKSEENANKLEHLLNSLKSSFIKEIILHAEEENNAKVIECLLPYINTQTLRDLFRSAVDRSKKEMVKLLVNEVNPIDFIRTLQSACKKEDLEIVNMLTDNTVVSDRLFGKAFCKFAANNDEEYINILHQKSLVSINDKEQAICLAAASGHKTMVEHLLTLEPRINSGDEVLCEAICLAMTNGEEEVAELLLDSYNPSEGIMIQNPSNQGFLLAAKKGHAEIITDFLYYVDYKGIRESIRLADRNGHGEVVEILREHAKSMILGAVSQGNVTIVKSLLEHFIDSEIVADMIRIATINKDHSMLRLLRSGTIS